MKAWFDRVCFPILVGCPSKGDRLEPQLEGCFGALQLRGGLRNLARGITNGMSFGAGIAVCGILKRHAAQSAWERGRCAEAGQNDRSGQDNS